MNLLYFVKIALCGRVLQMKAVDFNNIPVLTHVLQFCTIV
jgi:hypothetical protein